MRRERRVIDRFKARDDDGNAYVVVECQDFNEYRTLSEPTQWVPGLKSLMLDDGSSVNFIDDNTFKIVKTDTIIRRV